MWDFGDGVKAGGESATHTYTQPGTYNAKVTVTDPGGKSATATVQIVVKPKTTTRRRGRPPPTRRRGRARKRAPRSLRLGKRFELARVLRRGLRYTVTCEVKCRVDLGAARGEGQRLGKSNARRIAAGHSRKIVVRLDRNVRRNLVAAMQEAGVRSLKATLVLKVRTADGTKTSAARSRSGASEQVQPAATVGWPPATLA